MYGSGSLFGLVKKTAPDSIKKIIDPKILLIMVYMKFFYVYQTKVYDFLNIIFW